VSFDRFAKIYDRFMGWRNPEPLIRHLKLEREHRLLDVGGGTGVLSYMISPDVIIVDESTGMLKKARENGVKYLIRGSAEYLPIKSNAIDRILCTDALHHFSSPETAIGEMKRVLKDDGIIVLEELDADRLSVKIIGGLIERLFFSNSTLFTRKKLSNIAGGEIEFHPYSRVSYIAVLKK